MTAEQPNMARVALITGAARRVGRAIALRLARGGFDIAFTYLNSGDEAESLVAEVERMGRRALRIGADFCEAVVASSSVDAEFAKRFDRLDLLVNNASLYEPDGPAEQMGAQLARLSAIHVEAPLRLSRLFASRLQAAGGSIVNMLDLLAERPMAGYLAYCSSKAALWSQTLGLARGLAPEVRVNGIAPGVVEWPEGYPEEKKGPYLRRVPLQRAGTPADVAAAVEFLAVGGTYMTGQVLRIDGGRSIS